MRDHGCNRKKIRWYLANTLKEIDMDNHNTVINRIEELIEKYEKNAENTYSDDIRIVYEDVISDLSEIVYGER